VDSHRPPEPHWYLHDIGAGPEARGRGVGSALLEHRLGLVDQSGTALMFLEATTPGSRRLYERFGFEAVGSVPTQPGQASTAMIRRA
jgi:ribosomal protein S18 acetylase RimI-like enzyme